MKNLKINSMSRESIGVHQNNACESEFHSSYIVKDNKNNNVGINILLQHFGNLWESALDRLNHQFNGFLMTIHHQGYRFEIYRVIRIDNEPPPLRLIKS